MRYTVRVRALFAFYLRYCLCIIRNFVVIALCANQTTFNFPGFNGTLFNYCSSLQFIIRYARFYHDVNYIVICNAVKLNAVLVKYR